jgi:hypothetical protein
MAWPGFSVTGNVVPGNVKPEPVSVAELMVTGKSPIDVKTISCVAVAPTATSPNAMLVALIFSPRWSASNVRDMLFDMLPTVAVTVTDFVVSTAATSAVKFALVALAGTVIVGGTTTAQLSLDKLTFRPPLGAATVRVTLQASVAAPTNTALLQESALNVADGFASV